MEHFVDGQSHDIAIDGSHSVEVPILRVLADDIIQQRAMFQHAPDQTFSKESRGALVGTRGWQAHLLAPRGTMRFQKITHPLGIPELVES